MANDEVVVYDRIVNDIEHVMLTRVNLSQHDEPVYVLFADSNTKVNSEWGSVEFSYAELTEFRDALTELLST